MNDVAIKFNHKKKPKEYEQRSFEIGKMERGNLNIYALSAPMADILYHFLGKNS